VQVALNANIVDQTTRHFAQILRPAFRELATRLQGEYGGTIEHLWIDFELLPRDGEAPLHRFRFQKRVSGRSHFGLPAIPDSINVGHFSVKPDFGLLRSHQEDTAVSYALGLIHKESEVLLQKQKKLGGFNAELFRSRFVLECHRLGYRVEA
jgi:hypothetical protein